MLKFAVYRPEPGFLPKVMSESSAAKPEVSSPTCFNLPAHNPFNRNIIFSVGSLKISSIAAKKF